MSKLRFIVVDRTRSPFLKEGESFYLKKILRYASCEWIEVKPVPVGKKIPKDKILQQEGEAIKKHIKNRDYVIALDREGQMFNSEGLALRLGSLLQHQGSLAFIVGGPLGISRDILDHCHEKLSLSKLTFTHEMSRIILLEQIYRAFTILKGTHYHK